MIAPDFKSYDVVLVNTSAGKDSQAMLDFVFTGVEAAGVTSKLVAVHADLGRVEWAGTKELAAEQVAHYGVRFEVVRRPQGDLLNHVEERGMWPGPSTRFCTSDHKRGQIYTLFTKLVREVRAARAAAGESKAECKRPVRILNCLGLRSEESDKRKAMPQFAFDKEASNGKRTIDKWLPIKDWTEAQVWARNRAAGTRSHFAYQLGMPRLSCVFCIFAPPEALQIAGEHNRALLSEYVRVEKAIGHAFKKDLQLVNIERAIEAGTPVKPGPIVWAQCA